VTKTASAATSFDQPYLKPHTVSKLYSSYLLYLLQNWSYCQLKFYTAKIGNFALFCCCDADIDVITFTHEPDQYPLKMYLQAKK